MGKLLTRGELDRRMGAWHMFYVERRGTGAIGERYGVTSRTIRTWLTDLGAQITEPELQERAARDRLLNRLPPGQTLCRACDVIMPVHESGLCEDCRGEEPYMDEMAAELEFESGWMERNLVRVDREEG